MAVLSATIPAGRSLSTLVDLGTAQLLAVMTPPQWTDAPLSFQFSVDGSTFYDMSPYDHLFTMVCGPGRWIPVDSQIFPKGVKMRVRSGHPSSPVEQTAD